jgi:CRP/FNR family transcriptional regulator
MPLTIDELREMIPAIADMRLLESIAEQGQLRKIPAGEELMQPGQYMNSVPIIVKGSIKILRPDADGKEVFLYYLNPGETCALSLTCCNANLPSEIRAVAEEDATLIAIPLKAHNDWTRQFSQWKEFVALTYQNRFQEMLRAIDDIAFKNMDERLLSYLRAKASQLKNDTLSVTHQDIANELGTSREVISRLLKKLEKENIVALGRNKIEVLVAGG